MTVRLYTEIPITNKSAAFALALLNTCSDLQTAINELSNLVAKANTMVTDNGDGTHNYNQVELQFGLTRTPPLTGTDTASAGYNLIYQLNAALGSSSNLTAPAVTQMLAQIG